MNNRFFIRTTDPITNRKNTGIYKVTNISIHGNTAFISTTAGLKISSVDKLTLIQLSEYMTIQDLLKVGM